MTLCIAWRDGSGVHFASDSRVKLAENSFADVGVKVLSLPYQVLDPEDVENNGIRTVAFGGELGMCFAGSAINSFTVKESLAEVLKSLQHVPGHTDTSMKGIASFIFAAYKVISQRICETAIGPNGRAEMLVGGFCQEQKSIRVFRFTTDDRNQHSYLEVLTTTPHVLVGTGAKAAKNDMPLDPTELDYLNVLRSVIADPNVDSVGGNVQYGRFVGDRFLVHGIYEIGPPVRHWRGGLDLNSQDFVKNDSGFVPGVPFMDPTGTLGL